MTKLSNKARFSKVLVHLSEAPEFIEDKEYRFSEFEQIALGVALGHTEGGYLKTKISVFFDNGECYKQVRIDLAKNDERGFRDHMEQLIIFANSTRGEERHNEFDRIVGNEVGTTAAFYRTFFDHYELVDADQTAPA
ncbi:conserved hypothetical protein [Roseibium sp. TrichSKD4]|uniref:LPD25 domain-containing protein n=1 Tax=Roseibium sp. TrichSKD4 TaxID=744980 RepID=UPI0001E57406|nr:LPD25 domain-containing protein [Roseibium sp. TrichSKD4]EFO29249.1 conserved hypothetical protein [Roseibium sp. TrichSKD4]